MTPLNQSELLELFKTFAEADTGPLSSRTILRYHDMLKLHFRQFNELVELFDKESDTKTLDLLLWRMGIYNVELRKDAFPTAKVVQAIKDSLWGGVIEYEVMQEATEHAVRWSKNMLVEVVKNHSKAVSTEKRECLLEAVKQLTRYEDLPNV